MAYDIDDSRRTQLTAPAGGDKLNIHDVSADVEKYITRGHLVGPVVERFTIVTTTGVAYTVADVTGSDVILFVSETNDEAHTITMPAVATARDGQKVTVIYLAASTANATFAKGTATAISGTHGAGVTQYQTFDFFYDATADTWFGRIPAIL